MIVDDHVLFNDALFALLSPVYRSITQAFEGAGLVQSVVKQRPDLLLLDINLPRLDGLEAAAQIRDILPDQKIIIVSMYNQKRMVDKVKVLALNGYILKDSSSHTLLTGIKKVLDGEIFIDPDITKRQKAPDGFSKSANLTAREKQIIRGLVDGQSASDIATKINLAHETVKSYRKNIYLKLEINSVVELVKMFEGESWLLENTAG
ncbi:response regulator [Dyadobacter jejuensis]|nr:response regulator transcription factor [Dyadobacter jejuensis]